MCEGQRRGAEGARGGARRRRTDGADGVANFYCLEGGARGRRPARGQGRPQRNARSGPEGEGEGAPPPPNLRRYGRAHKGLVNIGVAKFTTIILYGSGDHQPTTPSNTNFTHSTWKPPVMHSPVISLSRKQHI